MVTVLFVGTLASPVLGIAILDQVIKNGSA